MRALNLRLQSKKSPLSLHEQFPPQGEYQATPLVCLIYSPSLLDSSEGAPRNEGHRPYALINLEVCALIKKLIC